MDELVGEVGEALTDGPAVEEPHGFPIAGLAEEALAGSQLDYALKFGAQCAARRPTEKIDSEFPDRTH